MSRVRSLCKIITVQFLKSIIRLLLRLGRFVVPWSFFHMRRTVTLEAERWPISTTTFMNIQAPLGLASLMWTTSIRLTAMTPSIVNHKLKQIPFCYRHWVVPPTWKANISRHGEYSTETNEASHQYATEQFNTEKRWYWDTSVWFSTCEKVRRFQWILQFHAMNGSCRIFRKF